MATEIKVPTLGESVTEATIARWLKKAGDTVTIDEPLVELETDKVTLEVGAPASGVLTQIIAETGATVAVNALLGVVDESTSGASTGAGATPVKRESSQEMAASPTVSSDSSSTQPLAPAVRKLVEEIMVDVSKIQGTGKDGRVTKGDVLSFAQADGEKASGSSAEKRAPSQPVSFPAGASSGGGAKSSQSSGGDRREERVPMTRLRKRIAERLKSAQDTAAILTTFNEVDMSAVMEVRNRLKDRFEKKHNVKLGFMSFFVKACVTALKEIPAVNAKIEGDDVVYHNYCDVGVAVGTPQGLVVPIVRNAEQMSFAEIEGAIAQYGQKAKEGKLSIDDLTGGTFTVSNGGVYGSLMSTPILNPPQSAILGMHKIQDRPVVVDGTIVIRPMMYLALSYDHRIIDGKEAVTFLVRIKECIEAPERILLDA